MYDRSNNLSDLIRHEVRLTYTDIKMDKGYL